MTASVSPNGDKIRQLREHRYWTLEQNSSPTLEAPPAPELASDSPPKANGAAKDLAPGMAAAPAKARRWIIVEPKGLSSFTERDSQFFLDLLPGPRGRDGLPESISFWKRSIEESHEGTFGLGLIYGPSGCGKSSLVRAGLLPQLAPSDLEGLRGGDSGRHGSPAGNGVTQDLPCP